MPTAKTRIVLLVLLASPLACFSDASYDHTQQVTGGQLIDSMKNMPFISRQIQALTDPATETTMVHGNQKAVVGKDFTEITDLDRQVMIHIDHNRKTYTVTTFADMRKMMEEMPAKMAAMQQQMKDAQARSAAQQGPAAPSNLQTSFTTTVSDPGMSKTIDGQNAVQQIVTMKMTVIDTNNPGTHMEYTVTTEVWTTPDLPAEMKEVRDFDMRFGQKLMQGVDAKDWMASWANMRNGSNAAMAQMFGGKPGAADAFAQMQKELAKIKGTRILEIQRMGGTGTGITPPAGGGTASAPAATPNGGSVTGQVAADTATQSAAAETSRLGIVGSALGGSMLNAFHRKKAAATPAAAPAASPAPAGQEQTASVTLMEMTTQTHNFSSGPVNLSAFQIPAGYKQVASPMEREMAR